MTAISATRRSMKELVDGTIRVQLDIDPAFRDDFLRLFSKIDMPVAIAPLVSDFERITPPTTGTPDKPDVQAVETGHWVSALYKSGWWFNPKVQIFFGKEDCHRPFTHDELHIKLRQALGVNELKEASGDEFINWATVNNLYPTLPLALRTYSFVEEIEKKQKAEMWGK